MFQISREMDLIIHGDEKMDLGVEVKEKLDHVIHSKDDITKIQNSFERENICKEDLVSHADDFCPDKNILK
jgi:hypothetical protein